MNFIVKLSRNTKVMIPIVIVLALTIFGSGALINKQQKVARQNNVDQQEQTEEPQRVAQTDIEEAEPETASPQDAQPSAATGATTELAKVAVEPTVTENADGTVTITAKLDTTEPGNCITTIQETQFTAVAADGSCEFKDLSIPVDVASLKIEFTADESGRTGSTRIE